MGDLVIALLLVCLPVVVLVAVVVFRVRMARPSQGRGAAGGRRWVLDGGLRLVSGEAPGVTHRWRHGRVVVEPGIITLRPYLLGLRFLPGTPVSVAVSGVDLAGERTPGLKESLGVWPGARLVPVRTTSGAVLELALVTSRTDELFAALASRPAAAA